MAREPRREGKSSGTKGNAAQQRLLVLGEVGGERWERSKRAGPNPRVSEVLGVAAALHYQQESQHTPSAAVRPNGQEGVRGLPSPHSLLWEAVLTGMAGHRLSSRSGPASHSQVLEMLQEQGRQRACSRSMRGSAASLPHSERRQTDYNQQLPSDTEDNDQGPSGRGEQTGKGAAHPEHLGQWELCPTSLQTVHEASLPTHPPLRAPLLLSLGIGMAPCLPFSSPVLLIPC